MSLTTMAHNAEGLPKKEVRKVTRVNFENVKEGSTLTIKDVKGIVLYKEAIDQTGKYSKGFDLTTLPNGDYYFELNSDLTIEIVPFTVGESEAVFKKEDKELIYKPVIRKKEDLVYVWKPTIDKEALNYTIYYADSYDQVLSEDFAKMEKVSKTYDFSQAKKGKYVFVFESKGVKYSKTIKI